MNLTTTSDASDVGALQNFCKELNSISLNEKRQHRCTRCVIGATHRAS
jgi:hypothetical protein